MRCLFISDSHYPKSEAIIDFLFKYYDEYDNIFILGDLFEFYYGYRGFFYPHHLKLINLLNIISNKKKVFIFEGNHEYNLEVIKEFVNVEVVKRELVIKLDDFLVHLEHGDTIDKKDIGYRMFRGALKNRFTLKLIDRISPRFLYFLSQKASEFSKKRLHSKKYRGTDEALERFAESKIEDGTDVVILAHTHNPIIKRIENGLYINSGDFFKHLSYVVYDSESGFSLESFRRADDG